MLVHDIYVHSKMIIIDDLFIVTGSANMDNVSYFSSSELSVTVNDPILAKEMRIRLLSEHLGAYYTSDMDNDIATCFDACNALAIENDKALSDSTDIQGRLVYMMPIERYQLLMRVMPTKGIMKRVLSKFLIEADTLQLWKNFRSPWSYIPKL